ncbi:MAG: hypothetical protein HOP11_00530 [Saprospiraceae bacterium]|nr:hypothetical protein [Saprospiraceae bacterium]
MYRILFFSLCLLFVSCRSKVLFSDSVQIKNEIWLESQNVDFEWEIKDTTMHYDFILDVHYNEKIPAQNIYVSSHSVNPVGKANDQSVSLELLDPVGKPYGACSFGSCNVKIVMASNIYFPIPGKYLLSLHPYSRIDSFPGIKAVGLIIEKTSLQDQNKKPNTRK